MISQETESAAKKTSSYITSKTTATSYAESSQSQFSDSKFPVTIKSSALQTFTDDISAGAWYYENVNWVYQRGLMSGMSDISFAPDQEITIEQVLMVLYRVSRALNNTNPTAPDAGDVGVLKDQWYYAPVTWAIAADLMEGIKFTAGQPLTRGDMAMILYRWFVWNGISLPNGAGVSFKDEKEMPAEVAAAFRSLKAFQIFEGDEDGRMAFTSLTSRGQFAALAQRICTKALSRTW